MREPTLLREHVLVELGRARLVLDVPVEVDRDLLGDSLEIP